MLGVISGLVSQRFLLQCYGLNEKIKNFSGLDKAVATVFGSILGLLRRLSASVPHSTFVRAVRFPPKADRFHPAAREQ